MLPESKCRYRPKITMSKARDHTLGIIMVQQFNVKAGIAKFGDCACKSIEKELTQLHDMETYVPMGPDKMTPQQKSEALNLLMFLVEKRDGRIKSRACADGRKQHLRPAYKKKTQPPPPILQRPYLSLLL